MSDERPDYVHCVKKPDGQAVWCGRDRGREFFFTDIEHAILNAEQGGRLLMCQDCEVEIAVALRTASSGEGSVDVERMDALESRWIHPSHHLAGPLTKDELLELQVLKRRYEARYREPSTLPPEVRASVDRILAAKKRRAEEFAALQRGQREIDKLEAEQAEAKTLRCVLARISEQLRESHGEHYDEQIGISSAGLRLLEIAWNERGGAT